MPEEEIEKPESSGELPTEPIAVRRRRYFTRRNTMVAAGLLGILVVLLAILSVLTYRYGVYDNYIKAQFVAKMADIGMVFDAEVFRVTVNPLELELKNATFKDRLTGENLFAVREAHLELTVQNLYAWQLSRDISIDKTQISGVEAWVKFDENGRSNFANLRFVENEPGTRVNFKYQSVDFQLQDSIVHFGDLAHDISGNARNVLFLLSPENRDVREDQLRYKFDLTSSDSNFVYDQNTVEKIDIRATGVADHNGADVSQFDLRTPIGESHMTGRLTDWASVKYDLDVQSTVDLTQASGIFAAGTSLIGVGNFKGKVTGEGANYKVVGEADAESLRAGGVYLKGVDVTATVEGTNSNYDANGTAIARMLTFEDFRIDFLKLVGNVRGTGTDFRWLGDLQAAAAKTPHLTLGGLFLSDALAEYKDRQLRAEAASGRAQKFSITGTDLADLSARNIKISTNGDTVNISAPTGQAGSLVDKDYDLHNITGRNIQIKNRGDRTDVRIDSPKSETAGIKNTKVKNVSADQLRLTDLPASTKISVDNLRAGELDVNGTRVDGIEAASVDLEKTGAGIVVYSDKARVAKIDSNAATLGSINIGGVRMTIRQGRIEARSNDFDAGNISLKKTSNLSGGGTLEAVKLAKPVFILEPSGRYRATADMSLGGGALGSVSLGAAHAAVEVNNDRIALNDLTADVMNGHLNGSAVVAFNNRTLSRLNGDFSDLDIGKLLALQSGRVIPIEGQTTGNVALTFYGTSFRAASGTVNAEIAANAGTAERGLIPITGQVKLTATNGLFNVDVAKLSSEKSNLTASGRFDLRDENSNLALALRSTDASEVDRLIRVLGISPDLEQQLDSMQFQAAGNLTFDGTITGNLSDPTVEGRASLDSFSMRGREVGSVSTDVSVSPTGVALRNGKLQDRTGGSALFAVDIPNGGSNNVAVKATLTNINAGNLLAALPISLPERIRDVDGQTSGTVDISGLPNNARGEINLSAAKGIIAGQAFDGLTVKAVFNGSRIDLQQADMRIGNGRFTANGTYERTTQAFDLNLSGKGIPSPLLLAFLPNSESIPVVSGDVDFTAKATGIADQSSSYNVNFSGAAPNVIVNGNNLGQVAFKGQTTNKILTADLTASFEGRPQIVNATLNFGDEKLPFMVATDFNQSPIAPFISLIPELKGLPITGTGTGRVEFGGDLSQVDNTGKRVYSATGLTGTAAFSQLDLQIQDTPLAALEPVLIRFNTREIVFEKARFGGGGSNMTIAGTKALTADGMNNLSIDGRVSLNLLNLATKDIIFAGYADAAIRLVGPNSTARVTGAANITNGSVAAFLGADRFTVDRLSARVIFTSNQVEVEQATGYLGGGKFTANGGGILGGSDGNSFLGGLALQAFRLSIDGNNVTVPLPTDFVTTGDAQLEISGRRPTPAEDLQTTIAGRIFARRSLYSKDIDLASIVGGRREAILTSGGNSLTPPRFDLVIEGRDALIVRNNIADLTASVSLALAGDANNPELSGRITANSGTILFRKDRYDVQRGVLEFPPGTGFEPIINLQAEAEIAGYQVFVNLAGPLNDSEQLSATLRSSPALPQADVVSLITTGNLTNTGGGIPTFAQTGINTAAEILTDAIINTPVRKATDKLFGLNVFEIDPIISGQNLANPSARLTVGRQINNKLRVTYSTNLSQDQNQILALEYRVSNKLSFVAQYEQRSLANVTRNRDNFSFEIRFRRRF